MRLLLSIFVLIFNLFTISSQANSSIAIHVFGDSHSTEFSQIPGCVIHYLGPITMHRVGRDNISFLNLTQHGVLEKQVAIFAFGEIDVRFHILKQQETSNRSLDEIIDTLANQYLNTILVNWALYEDLTCIVYSVTPPTDNYYPEYRYGPLKDRIYISKLLNTKLSVLCHKFNIPFLNVYDDYANDDGSLNIALSDGTLHINPSCHQFISQKLEQILFELE